MRSFTKTSSLIMALFIFTCYPAYAAENPTRTRLSKSIEPSLKSWTPISVLEQEGKIFIQLPRDEITDRIYRSIIQAGLCLGKLFKPELDWSGIKSVTIANRTMTQGFVFNGGEKECEIINAAKVGKSIPLLSERKSIYTKQTGSEHSKWYVVKDKSEMDDSKTVAIAVEAEEPIKAWLSKPTPFLMIICKENKTSIFVYTYTAASPEYGSGVTVRIRLDKGKLFKQKWREPPNNVGLLATRPISLARKMAKAKKMLFQFRPHNSEVAIASFDIRGLSEKLPLVANACEWQI